jgi:hypothetical protein
MSVRPTRPSSRTALLLAAFGCNSQVEAVVTTGSAGSISAPSAANAEPSEAEFAAELIRLLDGDGRQQLRFDAASGKITNGTTVLSTRNLYREHLTIPVAQRASELQRLAKTMMSPDTVELTAADAPLRLRPVVRAASYFDIALQTGRERDPKLGMPLFQPLGEATGIGIGIDWPDKVLVATDTQLAGGR